MRSQNATEEVNPLMSNEVLSLEQLESELKRLIRRYGAQRAYLFGSYARGEAHADSDVDVLVVGGPRFVPSDIFAIAEELYLAFGKRVDVYEVEELEKDTPFYRSVIDDRVLVA